MSAPPLLASIPSPSQGVWYLGPVPIRAYALCILAGVVAAVVVGDRRLRARGGHPAAVADVATVAVPVGLVGARLYHVLTDLDAYRDRPVEALYIWQGGLGIWGGIAAGVLAAYWVCRRRGIDFGLFVTAALPGVALAQAIGRLGNWFNQELYGAPTDLPWALEIDPANRPAATPEAATYHPTFLYEALWDLGVFAALVWLAPRLRVAGTRMIGLYAALYCLGRLWIELLRVDDAAYLFGVRFNVFTSVVVGLAGLAWVLLAPRRRDPESADDAPRDDLPSRA